ncbi:diacylglycerol kinase family protein [Mangrovicoccus sp. HB161399]|uniref:diacylglycerol kinase family protein n=1 Tax=Mangrovicoccus sp. HB161399 TaxID=2720392 RepID=UPI001555AB88|nr:diacylglycerol kinase family protein [Mangrovicoccus sp. HB161399]
MRPLHPRIATFVFAARGLRVLLRQPNARIHAAAAALAAALGLWFRVSAGEWIALIFAIALVTMAEAMNTALECVVDIASPEWSELARDAKDVAAAAVLISALGALAVGAIVFWPHLFP